MAKLGDICIQITDGSHNPPMGVEQSNYLMLSSKNIDDDHITFNDPRYLSQEDFEAENKRTNIKPNDLLITIVGTIGRVAIVPNSLTEFCVQRSVAVLKPKPEMVYNRFLMYYLKNMRPYLEQESRGVAQKGIYLKQLSNLSIILPPLDEQRKIAAALDKVSDLIAKRRQQLDKLDELIKAICVCSANDAAVAVAEFVGGSEEAFAEMMNQKAAELGMTHTHFVNACGLDAEGHYSSARDVARMSVELLHHPKILEYSQIWMDSLRGGETQIVNTNKLLKTYPGTTGLKTGTTSKAGVCIAATAQRDGMNLLAVVLGSDSGKERFESAATLLDYGFATYELAQFPAIEGKAAALPVSGGVARTAPLSYSVPKTLLVAKGEGAGLTATVQLAPSLAAPVAVGTQAGKVMLKSGDTVLAEYPVTIAQDVPEMDFSSALQLMLQAVGTI